MFSLLEASTFDQGHLIFFSALTVDLMVTLSMAKIKLGRERQGYFFPYLSVCGIWCSDLLFVSDDSISQDKSRPYDTEECGSFSSKLDGHCLVIMICHLNTCFSWLCSLVY